MLAILMVLTSMTGTWVFDVQTDAGSGSPTFVLKQEGERLSGTYSGQLGEAEVAGTVKGGEFTIEFELEAGGQNAKVRYVGAVESDGTVKGSVTFGTMAEGTFTGKRKAE